MLHTALQNVGTPNNAFDIAYHMYWPSSSDPFYNANTVDNLARKTYYNVTGTPTFKVDGSSLSWPQIEPTIQARIPIPSPLWLDLNATVNGSTVDVTTSAVANTAIQGNYVIHIVVLDRFEYLPASPNGQPNHWHSMRQMLPTASGQAFSATANDTVHHSATFTINPSWGTQNDIDVACFVQDNTTKEVLQGHCEPLPVNYPGLTLTLTPINPPIVIPATGGSFTYDVTAANSGSVSHTFQAWCMLTLPTGSPYGPLVGPVSLTLAAGGNLTRQRTQNIPATAPSGNYTFTWNLGAYPSAIWVSASFPFTKSATGDGEPVTNWNSSGDSFEGEAPCPIHGTPAKYALIGAYPNPFNPLTAISYQLPADSYVSLNVYSTSGKLVATLVEGWRAAGTQEVTFDGSNLASGVYVYHLTAGDFAASGKMILMK
jgi:hypothetical protein